MAEILKSTTWERQGRTRGNPNAGQFLLDWWGPDFSRCSTELKRHEVERIILGGPNGKRPGPDGVPNEILKRYARQLSSIFLEAWAELTGGGISDGMRRVLGTKMWMVVPKVAGANHVEKLRDLELGNEIRKVIARMFFLVLDEVCCHPESGLCQAQQAFVKGCEILRNTTMMLRTFWDAAEVAQQVTPDLLPVPLLLLLLDCSKGYNNMDHGWIRRCLEKANTPPPILNIVEALPHFWIDPRISRFMPCDVTLASRQHRASWTIGRRAAPLYGLSPNCQLLHASSRRRRVNASTWANRQSSQPGV